MDYKIIVRDIPKIMHEEIADKFMDIILKSDSADAVSPSIAKNILHYWNRNKLASDAGLINLTKAIMAAEPDKAISIIDELGLEKTKLALREIPC